MGYGLRTEYEIRTRYKASARKYGLGIKYGIEITAKIEDEDPAGCKIRTTLVKTVLIGSR